MPPEIQIKASMEALGAITATIGFRKCPPALATGTVDGRAIRPQQFTRKKRPGAQDLALTKHVYTPMCPWRTPGLWQRLPPEQRAAVTEEAVKAGNEARRQVQEKDARYIAEMEKAGMQTPVPRWRVPHQMEPA